MDNHFSSSFVERAARRVARAGLDALDAILAYSPGDRSHDDAPPIVFIVGPPRSGTTLIYQTLVAFRRFAFINNVTARLPKSAARVARLFGTQHWKAPISFESRFGGTSGLAGPNEAVAFWERAFPPDGHHTVGRDSVDPERTRWLVRSVADFVRLYGAPFLSKNPCNSLRIPALASIFPLALFIIVERDEMDVASSLLRARQDHCGDAAGAFSVQPRELAAQTDLPPVDYVASQVVLTNEAIEAARRCVAADRFLTVAYTRFCEDPQGALKEIDAFCARGGMPLMARNPAAPLPRTFRASIGGDLQRDERKAVERTLRHHRAG